MNQINQNEIPIFVARNLTKLPPVTFNHVDVTRLLKDMVLLQREVATIRQIYVKEENLDVVRNEEEIFKTKEESKSNDNINILGGISAEDLLNCDQTEISRNYLPVAKTVYCYSGERHQTA